MRLKVFRGESRDLQRMERDVNAFAKKIESAGGTWSYSYTLYGEKVMFTVSSEWFDDSSAKS